MKTWGIVDCHTGKIVSRYVSDEADQKRFGGPWGDPKQCEHILYDDSIDSDSVAFSELSVTEVQVEVGTQMVPDGDPRQALDDQGEPMVDQQGEPIMVQDHVEQPIMETQKRIVQE